MALAAIIRHMNISVCRPNREIRYPISSKLLAMVRAVTGLRLIAFAIALGVTAPVLVILASFLHPEPEIWQHIIETLLGELLKNTVLLCVGVLAGTFVLGVGAAWLTAVCASPGRKFFNGELFVPLAGPT